MYSEWDSIESEVVDLSKCKSVLHNYPPNVGRDVAKSVVSSLIAGLSFGNESRSALSEILYSEEAKFSTKADVDWCMQVVCFGLSLTLSEIETLRNCVNVYLGWLNIAKNPQNKRIPKPIQQNPMFYTQQMLLHLQNLFIPRSDGDVSDQIQLCVPVLLNVEQLACDSPSLDRSTWESLLKFLLNICNTLLGPPSQANSLGSLLCKELMHTLMRAWLSASAHCFPTPSLWKTARDMFTGWRHHLHVIDYWCRTTAALTSRVTAILYGPKYPKLSIPDADMCFMMKECSDELVVQTWYRFMHMISNPVDLSIPSEIAATPRFYESVLHNDGILDPAHHPCLNLLPQIFLRAIKGVSIFVDAFIGLSQEKHYEVNHTPVLSRIANPETPTQMRKTAKVPSKKTVPQTSTSSIQSKVVSSSSIASQTRIASLPDMSPKLTDQRPLCNSVLNLFGQWLFDAALAGCKFDADGSDRLGSGINRSRSSSAAFTSVPSQLPDVASLATNYMFDLTDVTDTFDAGRSEACAILCRIFTTKKAGENILPTYLSRFYMVLSQGLLSNSHQVVASIILNSFDLLRLDLPGVNCLLPSMLTCLESILPDRELYQFQQFVNIVDFRRASLHLLLSMIPLTLHFDDLLVQNIQTLWNADIPESTAESCTFRSLRLRMVKLLIGALQCESDSTNIQMILGGFLLSLQDSSLYENSSDDGTNANDSCEEPAADTAHGMFVQCVYLVSQRLDAWKSDLNVTIAALQLLGGMAQLKIPHYHGKECRQAVHELCHYIVQQCERPKPHHKREMHSMIVCAFVTLSTWLLEHAHLLDDKECLREVLEIIELGISGSKSSRYDGSSIGVTKEEKELNPVSMRVLEAAEHALHCVFEHVGAFPSQGGTASLCSLLDERDFVTDDWSQSISKFQYVVVHRSILFGVLEDTQQKEEEKVPCVTMVSRSTTGRKVWTWKFKQTPNVDNLHLDQYLSMPSRPTPNDNIGKQVNVKQKTFPDGADRIPLVKADCSIPLLSEVPNEEQKEHMTILRDVIEKQEQYDKETEKNLANELPLDTTCTPAPSVSSFHSARLLLSHLNLLTLSTVQHHSNQRHGPDLVLLNKHATTFASDIAALDSLPVRNNDTVLVFYHRSGQTTKQQVLSNMSLPSSELQQSFIEFLLALGWPVDVSSHPGWTGNVATSFKLKQTKKEKYVIDISNEKLDILDGRKYVLYYADVSTETVFLLPSVVMPTKDNQSEAPNTNNNGTTNSNTETKSRGALSRHKNSSSRNVTSQSDARIAVVWIENYDDIDKFPLADMFNESGDSSDVQNDHIGIFIHQLESGLFRVWVHGQASPKGGLAVPIVSGTIVSRRSLGCVVRLTASNLCQRRRLDNESYVQPHVRRKHKITDMIGKYQRKCTEPDFYTAVFTEK